MTRIHSFLLIIVLKLCQDGFSKELEGRIVGGHRVDITDYPYMVFVISNTRNGDNLQCGGSIISNTYVLTAAHCVKDVRSTRVFAGTADKSQFHKEQMTYFAEENIIYPEYNSDLHDYDVALVKLNQALNLDGDTMKAITLVESGTDTSVGTDLNVAGWGYLQKGGPGSPYLMAVSVKKMADDTCRKLYQNLFDLEKKFCAGRRGKNSCLGDSGGPIVDPTTNVQVGSVSYGQNCDGVAPVVYNKLSNPELRRWIKEQSGV